MAIDLVTSENREEYMEKKLKKMNPKKMDDEQYERARKHPKFEKLKISLGKKGAIDAILKEMNEKQ